MRPIVSCINSPTYNLAKYLTNILSKVVGKSDYNIRNSLDFVEKIKHVIIPQNHILLSLDVVSLYTNTPVDLALSIINDKWDSICEFTTLGKTDFIKGVEFCLTSTYFKFDNKIYRQVYGCAMGCSISSLIANLVMEDLEVTCINNLTDKPAFYYRYVDDIIMSYRQDHVRQMLDTFNAYHLKLQFTLETETNNRIAFLDTQIIKTHANSIIINWYQKPTHSWRYLNFMSNHPTSQKINILNNTIDKALKLSHPSFRPENLDKIRKAFRENNYPQALINKCIKIRTDKMFNQNELDEDTNDTQRYIALPYHNNSFQCLKHTFSNYNTRVAFTTRNNNNANFTNLKDPISKVDIANVVYSIPCECGTSYIGTTSQKLKSRLTQHKSDTTRKPTSTALAIHANDKKHKFNYDNVKILDIEEHTGKRLVSEMLHIHANTDNIINKKTDTFALHNSYKPLIPLIKRTGQ